MRPFLVCIHDATPAYAGETRVMIGDLAPLLGRRLALGVVPDWHGAWPLAAHPDYCRLLQESAEELLLHGYCHRRRQGRGVMTWLVEGSDEMNGLDRAATRRTLEQGQRVFTEVFGQPARGFLAPAWQRIHVRLDGENGLERILGFFALEGRDGRRVPLATWSWDWGRWRGLGYLGHGVGRLLQALDHGAPALALHPRDVRRGFWPRIVRLITALLEKGYEPTTPARLLQMGGGA